MIPWNLWDVILGDNYNIEICLCVCISLITVQVAHWSKVIAETYELAEECLQINYYGAKEQLKHLFLSSSYLILREL